MPRYLAIDYGKKRIGLAISDADGKIAAPLRQFTHDGTLEDMIRRIQPFLQEYEVDELVVGLPLCKDGTEGPQAQQIRRIGQSLAQGLAKPVHYFDESFSSEAADDLLRQRGPLTPRAQKSRRDALAATLILQSFLDQPKK